MKRKIAKLLAAIGMLAFGCATHGCIAIILDEPESSVLLNEESY